MQELDSLNIEELKAAILNYHKNGNLIGAIEHIDQALIRAEKLYGPNTDKYAKMLHSIAELYHDLGIFDKAEPLYRGALETTKAVFGESNIYFITVLNDWALLYRSWGRYEEAEALLLQAIKLAKGTLGEDHLDYGMPLHNLATVYLKMGRYHEAENLLQLSINIIRHQLGTKNFNYAASLNDLGYLYKQIGRFPEAERVYGEALSIAKEVVTEKVPAYVVFPSNLAALYVVMGRYTEAEPLFKEALSLRKEILGVDNPDYSISLHNLASLYIRMQRKAEAEPLLKEALTITDKVLGKSHPDYADTLDNLSILYESMERYSEAETITKEALEIRSKTLGTNHSYYARSLNNLGLLYLIMDRYHEAEALFEQALRIRKEILGDYSTEFAETLNHLASVYRYTNREKDAVDLFTKAEKIYTRKLALTYPSLSEKEKYEFLKIIQPDLEIFYSFVFDYTLNNNHQELIKSFQNFIYFSKANILSLTKQVKADINSSGDHGLINKYNKFITLRKKLAHTYTLSKQDLKSLGINLSAMEQEVNMYERELSLESANFDKAYSTVNIQWENIKYGLLENEALVDFVSFRYYDKKWTSTHYYCALISRPNFTAPVFIRLCTENDLEKLMNLSFRVSYVFEEAVSSELYNLIWKPIENYLSNAETIYISPSGILHRLSFAALKTSLNNFLCEHYAIRYIGNMKELLSAKDEVTALKNLSKSFDETLFAGIFGGATFGVIPGKTEKIETTQESELPDKDVCSIEYLEPFVYLKGTKTEAEKIAELLKNHNLKVALFTGADASEEALKSLNSKNSPVVLHIATHGFFFPEPDKDENLPDINTGERNLMFIEGKNPLFRSGLALAGANIGWSCKIQVMQAEDGIVTAYEITDMDLTNTELVVLSACETGLGDINNSEGVFGLQRSFKIAGARSIIMSLWKVPDRITTELMTLFYSNWLAGKSKSKALAEAQKKIRKTKNSAFFWGAFVLIE